MYINALASHSKTCSALLIRISVKRLEEIVRVRRYVQDIREALDGYL